MGVPGSEKESVGGQQVEVKEHANLAGLFGGCLPETLDGAHAELARLRRGISEIVDGEAVRLKVGASSGSSGGLDEGAHDVCLGELKPSRFERWIDAKEESKMVKMRFGAKSWNVRLVDTLTGHRVQLFFSALLVLDVFLVALELFMSAQWPDCATHRKHAWSCCPTADSHHTGLGGPHHGSCATGLYDRVDLAVGCGEHDHSALHVVHQVLFIFSMLILATFEMELVSLLVAMRGLFCYNPLYIMDMLIVTLTLVGEILMQSGIVQFDTVAIILVARGWRFFRVGHGLVISVHEQDMEKVAELRRYSASVVDDLRKLAHMEPIFALDFCRRMEGASTDQKVDV